MALNAKPRVYSLKELHDLSLDELHTLVDRAKVVRRSSSSSSSSSSSIPITCLDV